jgi:hypothetical protein
MPGGNSGVRVRYTVPVGGGRSPLSLDDANPTRFCSRSPVGRAVVGFRALVVIGVEQMAQACSRLSRQPTTVRQMLANARWLGWRYVVHPLSDDLHIARWTLRLALAHFPIPSAAIVYTLERHSQSQGKAVAAFSACPV